MVEVRKILGSLLDVVQLIEVPKVSLDVLPLTAVLREPQLAEQLVEVPVPSFRQVVLAPYRDTAGRVWCQWSGPGGVHWWLSGTRHALWASPEGLTSSPGRHTNTGQG